MYFGLYYFGQNFDLSVAAPVGAGGAQLSLLEVVVAAYNVGPAALENEDNTLSHPQLAVREQRPRTADIMRVPGLLTGTAKLRGASASEPRSRERGRYGR